MALNASAYAQDPAAALFGRSPTEQALVGASATNPFAPGLLIREEQRTKALIQQYMEALAQTNESRERVAGQELQYGDMDSQRDFIEGSRDRISDFSSALDYALPNMQYERPMQESADMTRLAQGQADVFGTGAAGVANLSKGGQVLPQGVPTPWGSSEFDPQSLMTPDQLNTGDGSDSSKRKLVVRTDPATGKPVVSIEGDDAISEYQRLEQSGDLFDMRAISQPPPTPTGLGTGAEDPLFGGSGASSIGGGAANDYLSPNETAAGDQPNTFTQQQLETYNQISSLASQKGMTTERRKVGDKLFVRLVKSNGQGVKDYVIDADGSIIDGE